MPRPSVVLDTNVVVSAHLNPNGYERFVLDLGLARKVRLCVSAAILEEYEGVLRRAKFGIEPDLVDASMALIRQAARTVRPRRQVSGARDPDDNKFLECAESAKASYLVTGNKRHFPARWGVTAVVNARELIACISPLLR